VPGDRQQVHDESVDDRRQFAHLVVGAHHHDQRCVAAQGPLNRRS